MSWTMHLLPNIVPASENSSQESLLKQKLIARRRPLCVIKPSLSNNWPNGECVHFKAPRHASKQDGSARNMIEPTMKLSNVPKFHIFEQKKTVFCGTTCLRLFRSLPLERQQLTHELHQKRFQSLPLRCTQQRMITFAALCAFAKKNKPWALSTATTASGAHH